MLKDKPINIADTNMALFGTDIEKEIKKYAAETEVAWKGIGQTSGLQIWRIEKFQVVAWPEKDYGSFFDGDSYIVLKTVKVNDALKWDVHFWLGEFTTQDEAGTAAYKTVELDDFLGGYPVEHREVQGHESKLFKSYFPKGLTILKGGVDTGFTHVVAASHRTRLLHIKGTTKQVTAREVPLSSSSLNSGDVFLLDTGLTVYQFMGSRAGIAEKAIITQLARSLDDERGGQVTIHVISESDMNNTDEPTTAFWQLLGGRVASIRSASEGGSDAKPTVTKAMYQLSDASGSLKITEVPFSRANLSGNDVFLIDVGSEVFVWVGNASSHEERRHALQYGQTYLNKQGKPAYTPVCRVMQGGENEVLLAHLQ